MARYVIVNNVKNGSVWIKDEKLIKTAMVEDKWKQYEDK